jgi:hypothetical protein
VSVAAIILPNENTHYDEKDFIFCRTILHIDCIVIVPLLHPVRDADWVISVTSEISGIEGNKSELLSRKDSEQIKFRVSCCIQFFFNLSESYLKYKYINL